MIVFIKLGRKCSGVIELEKEILKKGYSSLNVGRIQKHALTGQLSEQYPIQVVCGFFDVSRSVVYAMNKILFEYIEIYYNCARRYSTNGWISSQQHEQWYYQNNRFIEAPSV